MADNDQGGRSTRSGTSERGFAAMDANAQREIARKGGQAVSANREHMREIGRKGGQASHGGNRNNGNRGGNRGSSNMDNMRASGWGNAEENNRS